MKLEKRAQVFFDAYKNLCLEHGLVFICNSKSPKDMCFSTIDNGEIMGFILDETIKFDDLCKDIENMFFDKK